MTIELSNQAQNELKKGVFTPQIVVEIKGYPYLVSGEVFNLDPRKQGQNTPDFYNLIDLKGSQNEISQQLQLDKGGSSSTTSYKIRVIDKNEIFTNLFSFVINNQEILETEARVYFGKEGGTFPSDFIPFINGNIGSINRGQGWVEINVNHPDKNKKQEIFIPIDAELNGAIDDITTTIVLDDASDFLEPSTDFRTFIKIDDEIIEYTGKAGNTLTGVIRGALTSLADDHDDEAETTSFYEISGNSLEVALRILLSGSGDTDATSVYAVNDDGTSFIQNAIFFDEYDIREVLGASVGDFIDLTSVSLPGNDFTNRQIIDFGQVNNKSYYIVDGGLLTTELSGGIDASSVMRSQYDVWPEGCGLKMHQVDLPQFERIATLFATRFLDFNRYIKEEIDADEFINQEIYLPSSFYHLPRKGKNSIGVFNPPLTDLSTIRVDDSAVIKQVAPKLVIKRSTAKHFYNFVQFKFNEDSVEDKLLSTYVVLSADSTQRIKTKNKGLKIESPGLRRNTATLQVINTNAERIIERYRFAAEEIQCSVRYSTGLKVEIGDAVIFGNSELQVSDSSRGDRQFQPRIMQCINKSISFFTGATRLTLLDTNYSIFARYGVISPASKVLSVNGNKVSGESYCPDVVDTENETWTPFIRTRLRLRLPDFSYDEEFLLEAVTASGELCLASTPDLSFLPLDNGLSGAFNKVYTKTDLIVESTEYPKNADTSDQAIWKDVYVYFNPRLKIINVIDESNFEVDNIDIQAVTEKTFIKVHSADFTDESQEVTVKEINSNTITTNTPLSYLPVIGDEISLVGFIDGGLPYRFF